MAAAALAVRGPSVLRGGLLAVLGVVLALAVRLLLRPALGDASPFLLFTPAVVVGALYGGLIPGILATVLSTTLGWHFLLSGAREPTLERWDRVLLFAFVGLVITASGTVLRRSRRQLSTSLWREQEARARAEAADHGKDEFLALVSHELKTPMSVVLGWTIALREHRLSPGAQDEALDAIERNAHVLNRLIDDVLDRTRMATGSLRLDPQVMSLAPVVLAAIEQLRGRIEAGALNLNLTIPLQDTTIAGDAIRLQQVFTNILANAIKFTPKGGRVSVAMALTMTDATVTVSDTGCGIAPDFLPHVFDAFRQGAQTIPAASRGLGLGLSIAHHIVEQHHGTITVASDGLGCGSAFTIRLPLDNPLHVPGFAPAPSGLRRRTPSAVVH